MELDSNYSSVASLTAAALRSGLPISILVLKQQAQQMELPEGHIYEQTRKNYQVMADCIEPGCKQDLWNTSGLTGGNAYRIRQIFESGKNLTGSFLSGAPYRALTVSKLNAAMGHIVAAPTTGNCGILLATLFTMREEKGFSERDCIMSLFTVSAVGMVVTNNVSLAGAQGGCQAECGSAAAIATVAIVELASGTPGMVENAIAIAIKNILRLVYDPVTGLMEIPYIKRNASDVAGAFVAAELTLARIESAIPADEVIRTMKKMGDTMSSTLKETAEGGLAATPTGRRLHEQVFSTAREPGQGCGSCGGYPS